MKVYRYVRCDELENYSGWEIVQILPHEDCDMVVISTIKRSSY